MTRILFLPPESQSLALSQPNRETYQLIELLQWRKHSIEIHLSITQLHCFPHVRFTLAAPPHVDSGERFIFLYFFLIGLREQCHPQSIT